MDKIRQNWTTISLIQEVSSLGRSIFLKPIDQPLFLVPIDRREKLGEISQEPTGLR